MPALLLLVTCFGCREWEVRADHWADPSIPVEPECVANCCEDLRFYWATKPEEVFEGFEPQQSLIDALTVQTGFPDDVDFSDRAVLAVYLYGCPTQGMLLRPNYLRLRNGRVEGEIRRRSNATLLTPSRPMAFIETPADWAGDTELVYIE